MFCGSSSQYRRLVCGVLLWYCLFILTLLTCFFEVLIQKKNLEDVSITKTHSESKVDAENEFSDLKLTKITCIIIISMRIKRAMGRTVCVPGCKLNHGL